jgi:hypothetical protein
VPGADGRLRERILRTAAGAVAPGGVLLVVGHAGFPPWEDDPRPGVHLPTSQEVLEDLDLPDEEWEVRVCEEHERIQNDPGGRPVTRTDNTLWSGAGTKKRGDVRARCGAAYVTALRRSGVSR